MRDGYMAPPQVKTIVEYYADRYGARLDPARIIEEVSAEVSGAEIRVSIEDYLIQGKPLTTDNVILNLVDICDV